MPRTSRAPRRAPRAVGLLVAVTAALLPAGPAVAAVAPADLVIDLTFPAEKGGRYGDDYTQARSGGRTHCATDILGAKHSDLYAAVSGVITTMPTTKPSYGYLVNLQGDDGRRYSYVHLNDDTPGTNDDAAGPQHAYAPGLAKGSRVARGQLIGYLGDSGNAKGTDHLHFEIHDPAWANPACESGGSTRVNPYRSLRQAEAEADYAGAGTGASGGTPPPAPVADQRVAGEARSIARACPTGRVPASTFVDVGPTHRPAVDCATWWKLVKGTAPTAYSPTGTITRAQMATFVANTAAAVGSPLPATSVDHFDDDEGSVHEANIDRVAAAGIMGSATRSFTPDLAVSRGSMATILAKTYRYDAKVLLPPGPDAFSDDDTDANEGNIDDVAFNGIAVGFGDGTFRPRDPVTREQMATFVARLLDVLVERGHAAPPA